MSKKMYLASFLGIVAILGSIIEMPALTICFVIYLLAIFADVLEDANRMPPRKLGPDQFLDDLRLANSFPRMKEISSDNSENIVHVESILSQDRSGEIKTINKHNMNEKSTFLEMFEKLSSEEQEKVTQVALQI